MVGTFGLPKAQAQNLLFEAQSSTMAWEASCREDETDLAAGGVNQSFTSLERDTSGAEPSKLLSLSNTKRFLIGSPVFNIFRGATDSNHNHQNHENLD